MQACFRVKAMSGDAFSFLEDSVVHKGGRLGFRQSSTEGARWEGAHIRSGNRVTRPTEVLYGFSSARLSVEQSSRFLRRVRSYKWQDPLPGVASYPNGRTLWAFGGA